MLLQVVLVIRSQGTTTSWVSFVFHPMVAPPEGSGQGPWDNVRGRWVGGGQGGGEGGVVGRRKGHDKKTVR